MAGDDAAEGQAHTGTSAAPYHPPQAVSNMLADQLVGHGHPQLHQPRRQQYASKHH